jgi:hypothetical protein
MHDPAIQSLWIGNKLSKLEQLPIALFSVLSCQSTIPGNIRRPFQQPAEYVHVPERLLV